MSDESAASGGIGTKNLQAHHEDYSKPLDVRWACRKCHLESHGKWSAERLIPF